MANLGGEYTAGNETMDERSALPAGEYVAAMTKSETRGPNDAGNSHIWCEFTVQGGELQGRKFWTRLNLWNSNSTAVEIAQRELNSICHAVGKLRVKDTEELHGIPMRVKLKVKSDQQYGDQNEVASYKPLNAAPSGGAQPGQQQGGNRAPWQQQGAA